jgi:hypothetical protein
MLREGYMYPFRGYWGHPAHCHIAVYEHAGNTIVIATELDSNDGTSITNMAEYLATDVWHELGTPPLEQFIWIERYPDRAFFRGRPELKESFDLVTFTAIPPQPSALANQQHYTMVLEAV